MKVYSPSIIENLVVSGSSSFTGSLNVQGTISASGLTGTITTAETASYVAFSNVDGLSTFSSSVDSRLDAQESFSSSLDATFATDAELSSLSSSVNTRLNAVDVEISTLQSATASLDGRLDAIETVTSSLDTRVTDLESFSSSLDSEFATDAQLSAVSSSFNTRVGTAESAIDAVEVRAGLLESATASLDGRLDAVETTTSSFSGRLDAIETTTSSLSGRVDSIESFTSSIDTTIKTKLDAEDVVSSSAQIDVTGTTNYNLLPTLAGTNTLTGVNTFSNTTNSTAYTNGAVVVAGGVGIGKNLNVSGSMTVTGLLTAVSTSFQYVTSSQYVVGTSRIFLNDNDLVRHAGLSIYDSGSSEATASIFWDSLNHHFIYENISGAPYNSAIIIAGPKNTGSLGDELELTTNRVPVASGGDHIDTDPSISPLRIDGGDFHVESDTVVTGSVSATTFSGTFAGGVVSASSQVNHDSTTGFVSDEHIDHSTVSISAGTGLTGGGTIAANRTLSLTGQALALHNLATNGVIARTGAGTVAGRTITASTGISVSDGDGVSGNPTITNTGVTSIVAGTGIDISGATGAVTVSTEQDIDTGADVQFDSFGVGTAASGVTGEIRATAEVTAYYSSDRNLKTNITPLTDALLKVTQLSGVNFDWKDEHIEARGGEDGFFVRKHDVGVIAQEVEEVLPEVVATREDGTLAVRYEKIVPLLIEAIKELKMELDEVKKNCNTSSN